MKIAIIGYSGSGKSTLAKKLGKQYQLEVLHLDTVQFLPHWQVRPLTEKRNLVQSFLTTQDSWIIEGTYSKLFYDVRMREADLIIMLLFNRFTCLKRVISRYKRYKNKTRPDMSIGCSEKLDLEFIYWVLHKGRTQTVKKRFQTTFALYPNKTVVFKNQKQLNNWLNDKK